MAKRTTDVLLVSTTYVTGYITSTKNPTTYQYSVTITSYYMVMQNK